MTNFVSELCKILRLWNKASCVQKLLLAKLYFNAATDITCMGRIYGGHFHTHGWKNWLPGKTIFIVYSFFVAFMLLPELQQTASKCPTFLGFWSVDILKNVFIASDSKPTMSGMLGHFSDMSNLTEFDGTFSYICQSFDEYIGLQSVLLFYNFLITFFHLWQLVKRAEVRFLIFKTKCLQSVYAWGKAERARNSRGRVWATNL